MVTSNSHKEKTTTAQEEQTMTAGKDHEPPREISTRTPPTPGEACKQQGQRVSNEKQAQHTCRPKWIQTKGTGKGQNS